MHGGVGVGLLHSGLGVHPVDGGALLVGRLLVLAFELKPLLLLRCGVGLCDLSVRLFKKIRCWAAPGPLKN